MKSSLIPEKPILVQPSLATTIGLDESVMLAVLSDIAEHSTATKNNGYYWHQVSADSLASSMPFWDSRDLQRISHNLRDKGILLIASASLASGSAFKFAFNEKAYSAKDINAPNMPISAQRANTTPAGKQFIPSSWQPNQDTLSQLAQHNIPSNFAYEQIPEFVTYWKERKEAQRSWGSKFIQHVIHQWRHFETKQRQKQQQFAMHDGWRPSGDAMEILTVHAGISRDFINDAIPEFILYWRDRGDKLKTWDSKFTQHVRLQWKKYCSALEHSTDPKPIPVSWQPSSDVYDVLRLANIDIPFAQELIPEFVLYWRDSNQIHTSWNTRYLQHVKKQWAGRHALSEISLPTKDKNSRSTRDISLEEQLTDRSWAS